MTLAAVLPWRLDGARPAANRHPPPAQTAEQALAQAAPRGLEGRPIKVYLRGGLKTHAAGQHDYPQFMADWSKLLTERGAIVDGSFHFPTAEELADVDVIVMYKGDAGYMTIGERIVLENFLKRGGGLVGLHDAICADDTAWWASIMGGAKKHGETNFTLEAPVPYTFPEANPITQGAQPFEITDESFFLMTWAKDPGIKVLATRPSPRRAAPARTPARWCRRCGPTSARSSRASAASRPSAVRLDAGPQLRQPAGSARAADAAARHRLGGQGADRCADDRQAAAAARAAPSAP